MKSMDLRAGTCGETNNDGKLFVKVVGFSGEGGRDNDLPHLGRLFNHITVFLAEEQSPRVCMACTPRCCLAGRE